MKLTTAFLFLLLSLPILAQEKSANMSYPYISIEYSTDEPIVAAATVDTVYLFLDPALTKQAQFPGGEEAMQKFIQDSLQYPAIALQSTTNTKVTLRFVITSTGERKDLRVTQSGEFEYDKEALRIIRAMPNWIPAQKDGKAVAVTCIMPVLFKANKTATKKRRATSGKI